MKPIANFVMSLALRNIEFHNPSRVGQPPPAASPSSVALDGNHSDRHIRPLCHIKNVACYILDHFLIVGILSKP